ncbi:ankyrin repeat domain-containing protein [Planctomycetota bacterium]
MKPMKISQSIILLLSLCSTACIGATPSFSFQDTVPDVIIASQSPADLHFGVRAETGGDVNGDGYDDFVTTANRFNDCTGRAYLYFGGKDRIYGHADHVFDGENPGDMFGMWIYLADLNNDKCSDVIVGATGHKNQQGRVYVYYGGQDMDTRADIIFDGEPQICGWFGRVIDAADIDRDGYTDLILYAIGADRCRGRAYLYYGGDPMDTVADKIFEGENSGDVFGREMDMGPDVNGDGYGDIIFGSRSWNAPTFAGAGQGRAYLYYGGPRETMDTICDKVFTGENMQDQFGSSVCLFDIDNDGYAEVMVGARGHNGYQGRMYLYWGGTDIGTQPDLLFDGERGSDFGGDTIECGHFNDDAYGDILVGAYSGGSNKEGRIYLYDGAPKISMDTVCDHTFTGERSMFGGWFNIGNINGDKYDDLIVSAGLRRPNTNDTVERLYVYYTKPFPTPSEGLQPQFVKEISEDVQPMSFLHKAAAAGDIAEVKRLIATGANINSLSSDSGSSARTPLHEAAIAGHKDVAEILLSHGAQPYALDNLRYTPLHCSAEHGHKDMASLLIDKGADVNAKTLDDLTPLHLACQKGKREVAEFLMKKGADPKATDVFMMTPLHFTVEKGFREISQLLIEKGADVDARNKNGKTPLDLAISRNRSEIAKLLIEKGAAVSNIHTAASVGNIEKLRSIVEAGVDVNEIDDGGMTPLLRAVSRKHTKVAEFLVENGADVNTGDKWGYAPLVHALWNTDSDMVKLLLDKGADPNAKDTSPRYGHTPLHWAIMMDSKESTELVLAAGADVNGKSNTGETPLDVAAYSASPAMGELLVAKGAEISSLHAAAYLGDLTKVKAFIDEGAKVNKKSGMIEVTALHSAAAAGHKEIVEFLITQGAEADAKDRRGRTPLDLANQRGRTAIVELLQKHGAKESQKNEQSFEMAILSNNLEAVRELISQGANVNVRDSRGNTPLLQAIGIRRLSSIERQSLIKMLISAGADVNAKNRRGNTPLDVAKQRGHTEIVELLSKAAGEQTVVHDVAVTKVSAAPSCAQGDTITMAITLDNRGDCSESCAVKLLDATDNREIAGRSVQLSSKHHSAAEADLTFEGEDNGIQAFGDWIAVGNVNGDNYDDLVICAVKSNNERGKVYLYHGGPNMDSTADKVFIGEDPNDRLGCWGGAYLCDMNNDGFDDLLVGARFHNKRGRAYIFYGGVEMDTTADIIIDPPDADGEKCSFGRGIVGGDINGDGQMDLLISAPQYQNFKGRTYLYYGPIESDTKVDKTFTGENRDDTFGAELCIRGDVDGDGYNDLLTGTRYYPGNTRTGRVYLYYGGPGKTMDEECDLVFDAENTGDMFGNSIDLFDVDRDGHADVIVGASQWDSARDNSGNNDGRIYLYWGDYREKMNNRFDVCFQGEPGKGARLGASSVMGSFVNDDAYGNIIACASAYSNEQGRVYLYQGDSRGLIDTTIRCTFTPEEAKNHPVKTTTADFNGDGVVDIAVGGSGYGSTHLQGRCWLWYGPFTTSTNVTLNWDTTNASIRKHTLKVEIPPVPGEQNTEDNIKTVTIEVKEPAK